MKKRTVLALLALIFLPVSLAALQRVSNTQGFSGRGDARLAGLWSLYPDSERPTDPVRFFFFHQDGFGLFRYGRAGLNKTNSFDYRVDGDRLRLFFRKTGRTHQTVFVLEETDAGPGLRLRDDPYGTVPDRAVYIKAPPAVVLDETRGEGHPFARMWIDLTKYRTGGLGFSLYQFRAPTLAGTGVGWFHEGDFDDWSTEALQYRLEDETLSLFFTVRGERGQTRVNFGKSGEKRILTLRSDPRNFGLHRAYADGGGSFDVEMLGSSPLPLPLSVLENGPPSDL